jgi:hypothetical protein
LTSAARHGQCSTRGAARRKVSVTGRSSKPTTPALPNSRQVIGIAVASGSAASSAPSVRSPAWMLTNSSMSRTSTQSAARRKGWRSAAFSAAHCGPSGCGPSFRTCTSQPSACSRSSIASVPSSQSFENTRKSVKPHAR